MYHRSFATAQLQSKASRTQLVAGSQSRIFRQSCSPRPECCTLGPRRRKADFCRLDQSWDHLRHRPRIRVLAFAVDECSSFVLVVRQFMFMSGPIGRTPSVPVNCLEGLEGL